MPYVYLIVDTETGHYKIGKAGSVSIRRTQVSHAYRVCNRRSLQLLVPDDERTSALERLLLTALHEHRATSPFADIRNGYTEWFDGATYDKVLPLIDALRPLCWISAIQPLDAPPDPRDKVEHIPQEIIFTGLINRYGLESAAPEWIVETPDGPIFGLAKDAVDLEYGEKIRMRARAKARDLAGRRYPEYQETGRLESVAADLVREVWPSCVEKWADSLGFFRGLLDPDAKVVTNDCTFSFAAKGGLLYSRNRTREKVARFAKGL